MHLLINPIQRSLIPEHTLLQGKLIYIPEFFTATESDYYLQHLRHNIHWAQRELKLYGRSLTMPRLIAWYADTGIHYHYSGDSSPQHPWTTTLQTIRQKIETATGWNFNGVLLNLYRNGHDSMGWHADDEPELGPIPRIASASFGTTRRFELRHRHDKQQPNIHLPLQHGSLLLMSGDLQQHWQHQIPKEKSINRHRINLTFRLLKPANTKNSR